MNTPQKPALRPNNPRFSSGPCTKRPGWTPDALKGALLGRNHRQPETKARLELAITRTRGLLKLPEGYLVAIVPASDTGAVEMALWSLLGPRGVDVLAWEAFSRDWVTDITEQLKLKDVRALIAPYGELPDLSKVDFDRDVVFAWNGTTSGVRVPNGDFIAPDRKGLTICDATSAIFAQEIDWLKLDAATFSWQKVLGGEAQHGMLILSPRAVQRLESHTPAWPLPKLFRMTHGGKLNAELFAGVAQVGADARPGGQPAAAHSVGLGQGPWAVADRGNGPARVHEVAHERDGGGVHPELVRVDRPTGQQERVELIGRRVVDAPVHGERPCILQIVVACSDLPVLDRQERDLCAFPVEGLPGLLELYPLHPIGRQDGNPPPLQCAGHHEPADREIGVQDDLGPALVPGVEVLVGLGASSSGSSWRDDEGRLRLAAGDQVPQLPVVPLHGHCPVPISGP